MVSFCINTEKTEQASEFDSQGRRRRTLTARGTANCARHGERRTTRRTAHDTTNFARHENLAPHGGTAQGTATGATAQETQSALPAVRRTTFSCGATFPCGAKFPWGAPFPWVAPFSWLAQFVFLSASGSANRHSLGWIGVR